MNNIPLSEETFERYVADCRTLQAELQVVIHDLEFVMSGGHLRFAIDFSEIHPYITQDKPPPGFLLFEDEGSNSNVDIDEPKLRQLVMLHRIFDVSKPQLYLLPPYAAEFSSFVRNYHESLDRNTGKLLLEYGQYQHKLAQQTDVYDRIVNEYQLTEDQIKLSQQVAEEFRFRFLLLLSESMRNQTGQRVQRLLDKNIFADFPDDEQLYTTGNILDVHNRWFDELLEQRAKNENKKYEKSKPALASTLEHKQRSFRETTIRACEFDALALLSIWRFNNVHQNKDPKEIVLLITRSTTMKNMIQNELEFWNNTMPIRHPRVFNLYGIHPLSSSNTQIPTILEIQKQRLDIVRRFLKTYEQFSSSTIRDNDIRQSEVEQDINPQTNTTQEENRIKLEHDLDEIKSMWRATEFIPGDYHELREQNTLFSNSMIKSSVLDEIFDDEDKFIKFVIGLRNIETEWVDRTHDALVVSLPPVIRGGNPQPIKLLPQAELGALHADTSAQAQPYRLNPVSDEARQYIKELDKILKPDLFNHVLNTFSLRLPRRDERWILIAYIQGLQNEWSLAYRFCTLAAREAKDNMPDERLLPEILLLRAVCNRKRSNNDFEAHIKHVKSALRDLSEAISKLDPKKLDPRFLKEQATQVMKIYLDPNSIFAKNEHLLQNFPTIEQAYQWLKEAEDLCTKDDAYLIAQIQNNRLHFRLEYTLRIDKYTLQTRTLLLEEYRALDATLSQTKGWSHAFYDTKLWAEWNLFESSKRSSKEFVAEFNHLIQNSRYEFTPEELENLRVHLAAVQEGKRPLRNALVVDST